MPVTPTMLQAKRKRKMKVKIEDGTRPSKKATYREPVLFRNTQLGQRRTALGQMKVVKLNWTNKNNIPTATAGNGSLLEFAVSSAFKPDTILANSRQPMGYDQMTPLFDRYYVTNVKYKVAFWSPSNESRLVGVYISDRQPLALNNVSIETLVEQGLCQWKTLTQNTSGPCTTMFTGEIDCPKVVGKTYAQFVADDTYGSIVSSSPANGVFLYLFAANADIGATIGLTPTFLELEMTVRFVGSQITPAS